LWGVLGLATQAQAAETEALETAAKALAIRVGQVTTAELGGVELATPAPELQMVAGAFRQQLTQ
jgi:hypothetical protein